jgi:hypothetical protein
MLTALYPHRPYLRTDQAGSLRKIGTTVGCAVSQIVRPRIPPPERHQTPVVGATDRHMEDAHVVPIARRYGLPRGAHSEARRDVKGFL